MSKPRNSLNSIKDSNDSGTGRMKKSRRSLREIELINSEALAALEQSLKQQIENIKVKINNEDAKKENLLAFYDNCKQEVMNQTDGYNVKTAAVSDDTRVIIVERDEAMEELRKVEQSFSDVHKKYEKAKTVLENLRANEEHLKQRDEEIQLQIQARDQKLEAFKQEAHQITERMFNDFQTKIAAVEADNARLGAQFRRSEMRVEAMEAELQHKRRENTQLNLLADELIGKSGPGKA